MFEKSEYNRISNRLLQESMLGHGLHEDFLLSSAKWFHHRIGPNNECLADSFESALGHHVALIFALPAISADPAAAADLFDYLRHLVSWVVQLPGDLLRKSPEPLVLVVGHRGLTNQFGAQIMRSGGPSIIYWQNFSSLRQSLGQFNYDSLSDQIGKTVVHELIGHQLAFCSPAGPLITRSEISEILSIAKVDFIKLNDGSSLRARDFVKSADLLAALRRTEYVRSNWQSHRYYGNLAEIIAFAVEGVADNLPFDYQRILGILEGGLLRESQPVNSPDSRTPLYRSHDLSCQPFKQSYIHLENRQWHRTEALCCGSHWLSLHDCQRRFQEHLAKSPGPAGLSVVRPGQSVNISLPFDALALVINDTPLLISPFGMFTARGDTFIRRPKCWQLGDCLIQGPDGSIKSDFLTVKNAGASSIQVGFSRLNATSPGRDSTPAPQP